MHNLRTQPSIGLKGRLNPRLAEMIRKGADPATAVRFMIHEPPHRNVGRHSDVPILVLVFEGRLESWFYSMKMEGLTF